MKQLLQKTSHDGDIEINYFNSKDVKSVFLRGFTVDTKFEYAEKKNFWGKVVDVGYKKINGLLYEDNYYTEQQLFDWYKKKLIDGKLYNLPFVILSFYDGTESTYYFETLEEAETFAKIKADKLEVKVQSKDFLVATEN